MNELAKNVAERFMRYVQIDTQSDPNSVSFPSTEKQKNLSKILVDELLSIGVNDAYMDEQTLHIHWLFLAKNLLQARIP